MTGTRMRIDKWLWYARFYRSRMQAQEAAASGLLRVNGLRVEKPSAGVQPGDVVTLPRGRDVLAVRIEAVALRRGPSAAARKLYTVLGDGLLDPAAPPS
ncbi:MAG TPA: RNA-binding S4 domain-containing protein [Rhizomicrobium sp.]|jgi:ribosome-associated heat shock protein Hsp15|nr:RNA-binding S4 domain-containing protein [Rhizomicrobium sp.]